MNKKNIFLALCFFLFSCKQEESLNIYISIKNHKFSPASTIVPVGQKIKLIIKNNDKTVEEFESLKLKREKIIPSEGTAYINVGPLEEGVYEFYGEFNKETAQGELIVTNNNIK